MLKAMQYSVTVFALDGIPDLFQYPGTKNTPVSRAQSDERPRDLQVSWI